MKKTTLAQILKTYDNILWYPSAGTDFSIADVFSPEKLRTLCIDKEDCPDCFLLTDYVPKPLFESTFRNDPHKNDTYVYYNNNGCVVTAFNEKRLPDIRIGFDPEMITEASDVKQPYQYGFVFIADILIEYDNGRKYISKLIYAVAENTRFLYDYLLKNKISIKYLVRSCYGYGFGGGRSSGLILRHLLKDLGVKYFADDENTGGNNADVADRYLTDEQREAVPVLGKITNLTFDFGFQGYGNVALYKVNGFAQRMPERIPAESQV